MNKMTAAELKEQAKLLRKTALTMIYKAQSGHPGGSFSAADIVTALYFSEMNIDPKNPRWPDRDRFVLSKGHVCPIQYAALGLKGYFPEEHFNTLRKEGSILQGHPSMNRCPGIDISTGSLGQGISCATGMALAGKRDGKDYRVFVLIGDGESQEGQVWESAEASVKYQLDNLIVFVDNNRLQNDGACEDIMPTQDIRKKFEAFGFETYRIDGHSMEQILATLDLVRDRKNGKPKAIVCDTVKGKGVSFMENVPSWHGMAPNDEQYAQAMEELERGF
ncbi:MAG: transketolase [Lachnospiraceae bacterium]|nr:transketolase [Lachnospiraceae bacterium]